MLPNDIKTIMLLSGAYAKAMYIKHVHFANWNYYLFLEENCTFRLCRKTLVGDGKYEESPMATQWEGRP